MGDAIERTGAGEAPNRRREPREPRKERLFLQLALSGEQAVSGRPTLFAASANLSAKGLGVHCERDLEPGTLVECWVRVRGCEGNFLLAATVRWSRAADDGDGYELGLELLPEPGTDHLRWAGLFQSASGTRQQSA